MLVSILNRKVVEKPCEVSSKKGHPSFLLKEQGKDATLNKLTLTHLPEKTYFIKLDDKFPAMQVFLKDKLGSCKRCDYLVLTTIEKKMVILFLELKSKRLDNSDIIAKFKASQAIVDYLLSLIKNFHSISLPLHFKFVLLHEKKVSQATRVSIRNELSNHNNPNNFLRRACSNQDQIPLASLLKTTAT